MAERKLKNGDEFTVGEERYRVLDDKLYLMVATEIPPKADSHRCCDHVCWHYMLPYVSGTGGTGDFPLLTTTTCDSGSIGSVLSSSGALN